MRTGRDNALSAAKMMGHYRSKRQQEKREEHKERWREGEEEDQAHLHVIETLGLFRELCQVDQPRT